MIIQQEFQDPRLMLMTVLRVDVSRDLQHADIYYSVLGDPGKIEGIAKSLDKLSGHIRKLIGQRIRLRYTPQIRFLYDQSVEVSARIEETFREIHEQSQDQGGGGDSQSQETS